MLWFCRQKEKKKQTRDQRRAEMEKENQSGSHGKGYLKLFGVEIRTNVSDDEESMKKRISMGGLELSISLNNENDDNVGYLSDSLLQSSTPETAHHRKKKGIISHFYLLFKKIFVGFLFYFIFNERFLIWVFSFFFFFFVSDSMVQRRTSKLFGGIEREGKRQLERYSHQVCENQDYQPSRQPCTEVLSSTEGAP